MEIGGMYSFIAIYFQVHYDLELVVPVRVQFMGQIDLFENYLYVKEPCAKKKKRKKNP